MLTITHFTPSVFEHERTASNAWLQPMLNAATTQFQSIGIQSVANDWLERQEWKRVLAYQLFADLLANDAQRRRILEVGGGLSALTMGLAQRHDYALVELATHETAENYRKLEALLGRSFITLGDWSDVRLEGNYDIIIANDLFPNVDQRLYAFIDWAWPRCRELRLTLTYYENTVWKVKRIQSGEQLTICPWGVREMRVFLDYLVSRYPADCPTYDRAQLIYADYENVLFTNRRNVMCVRMMKSE
jgi:hypothetical protein